MAYENSRLRYTRTGLYWEKSCARQSWPITEIGFCIRLTLWHRGQITRKIISDKLLRFLTKFSNEIFLSYRHHLLLHIHSPIRFGIFHGLTITTIRPSDHQAFPSSAFQTFGVKSLNFSLSSGEFCTLSPCDYRESNMRMAPWGPNATDFHLQNKTKWSS